MFRWSAGRSDAKRDAAIPLPEGITECRDISYGPNGKWNILDVYYPAGTEEALPTIDSMVPFTPFSFFIERKLLIHNMGHALMAYYGRLNGYDLISEIACDGEIKYVLTRALIESARALSKRHNVPLDDMMEFVENLMVRFENPLLIDDVFTTGSTLHACYAALREVFPPSVRISVATLAFVGEP
jgi:hypothetical protein